MDKLELDLTQANGLPQGTPTHRIWKRQIYCRKCRKEVTRTEQTGVNPGRRIIFCDYFCHGEQGRISICEDQLTYEMIFDVFEGQASLRGAVQESKPPALPEKAKTGGPVTIDVEAEVTPAEPEASRASTMRTLPRPARAIRDKASP